MNGNANMNERRIEDMGLDELTEIAVAEWNKFAPGVKDWIQMLRPEDGTRGRFRWSLNTTRAANVAATGNILGGTKGMGILDEVITQEDIDAGIAWINSLHIGNEQYRDPALLDRKPPNWPDRSAWPTSGILNVNNSYARNVLRNYLKDESRLSAAVPPPGWPQPETADTAIDWIRKQPWDTNPWGAGSQSMRVARWLMEWHKEGKIGIDPLITALKFFYEIQDPETGLWGAQDTPRHIRINGAFKVFVLTRAQLDLPLPHGNKIIDQVLKEFHRPDYDDNLGGCDEWDNWYVLCMTRPTASAGYREEEIRKMAAWRIIKDFETFGRDDGGLASHSKTCTTHWCRIDMAPAVPQGDAMGPGTVTPSIRACADVLGIQDRVPWKNETPLGPANRESDELRNEIIDRLEK